MRARTLVVCAGCGYAANVSLGVATATRVLDTSRFRWLHHVLYTATTALTVLAVAAAGRGPLRRRLVPALVPLAVIPYVSARSSRHPIVALAAAPFYALAAWGGS